MNLAMAVIAVVLVKVLALSLPVSITLVALTLSPVPPILPKKMIKAGGGHLYVMALLFSISLISIVWIPLAGAILDRFFVADIAIPPVPVAKVVLLTVLGPTLAGVVVRHLAPGFAQAAAPPLGVIAGVLLLAGLALILVKFGPAMLNLIGDRTLIGIVIFLVLGLVVGHLFGGPAPADRTVLALATAVRHPGVAMTIAQITFPGAKAVPAVVLLYLMASLVVTLPYVMWRKKAAAGAALSGRPAIR
jgi:BASS family bile acid:Na+ symporter